MAYEIRVPKKEELADFARPVWRGFGNPNPTEQEMADELLIWEPDRSLGVVDGGEWVAGAGAFSFDLTVPGGATAPAAGVTMVGVSATHRRQGVLTAMMEHQLDDVVARGEPLAVLTASETSIYGRFGYGWATFAAEVELETTRSNFRHPPAAPGRLRMLQTEHAHELVRTAYDRCRGRRAGTISRSEGYWKVVLGDATHRRDGHSAMFVVVHEDEAGQADGFASWRVDERWPDMVPDSTLIVGDLYGLNSEVEAALWRFLLDVDLTSRVKVGTAPVDDPIRWRLVEPRRLRTRRVTDYLWVRLLDVPTALSRRTYGAVDSLVIEVIDTFRPQSGGRFRVEASENGADCEPTKAEPDLVMAAEDLGSIYLGGVDPSALGAAGRIEERTDGSLLRADHLFRTTPAPFNGTMF